MSTSPLGRVVATERRPNTPHEFHFWTALDSPVGIGTIVRVEGPEAAVYYRGVARLRGGRATVRLPDYFEPLTHAEDRTVLLTPVGEQPYLLSYTPIVDGVFAVYGDSADGVFAWQVMAVCEPFDDVSFYRSPARAPSPTDRGVEASFQYDHPPASAR